MSVFGEVFQMAYVVRDMQSALRTWTETFGVGPFHVFDIDQEAEVYGTRTWVHTHMALAWWNELQIELIQPIDSPRNPYTDFLDAGREGVHHVACLTRDWSATDAAIRDMGCERVLFGEMPGTRISYYATQALVPGTIVEIVEASEFYVDLLRRLKDAGRDWDGSDPVRPLDSVFA
jgi:4-hydroxyphenylpyruvate dioxygenase-like putative hemolysin